MTELPERIIYLLEKYRSRSCSWEEYQELFSCLEKEENKGLLYTYMDERYLLSDPDKSHNDKDWDKIYERMISGKPKSGRSSLRGRFMAAAVVLIGVSISAVLWFKNDGMNGEAAQKVSVKYKNDIAPGTDKAMLTLADGSQIPLNGQAQSDLASQGNAQISKTSGGTLVYEAGTTVQDGNDTEIFNMVSTPQGGKYQLILSDGTKVWLNANSSLRFPAEFKGKNRKVELNGEAYFEVTKNAHHPFSVASGEAAVEVLGTHFNVMSYKDEPTSETTLLEGSVRLKKGTAEQLLKPGQQAVYSAGTSAIRVSEVDTEEAVAWKNDLFIFDGTDIDQVMRQIKRWYNVEVIYSGTKPTGHFTGVIPRNRTVSKVLDLLESAGGVNFGVDGNKIIVKKK